MKIKSQTPADGFLVVSSKMPVKVELEITREGKRERRARSPMVLVLVEEALAARRARRARERLAIPPPPDRFEASGGGR